MPELSREMDVSIRDSEIFIALVKSVSIYRFDVQTLDDLLRKGKLYYKEEKGEKRSTFRENLQGQYFSRARNPRYMVCMINGIYCSESEVLFACVSFFPALMDSRDVEEKKVDLVQNVDVTPPLDEVNHVLCRIN